MTQEEYNCMLGSVNLSNFVICSVFRTSSVSGKKSIGRNDVLKIILLIIRYLN